MLTLGTETNTFDFKFDNSEKVYSLPPLMSMPIVKLRAFMAAIGEVEKMPEGAEKNLAAIDTQLQILREFMGDDADLLTAEAVSIIFDGWMNGAELGE